MSRSVVFIHTVRSVVGTFDSIAAEILGDEVQRLHIVDDLLLQNLLANRQITSFIRRHFAHYVNEAEEFGADAVLLTCSSIAPCVDATAPTARIPVFRIDEAMVDRAMELGRRIGLLATIDLALAPLHALVLRAAEHAAAAVETESVICRAEAYAAMLSGNTEKHDAIVREELQSLMTRVDVVLLAQLSMASALERMGSMELTVPVLTSPRLAMDRVRKSLGYAASRCLAEEVSD